MKTEAQHIIEHMSAVELCMLEDRGMVLPPLLAAKAATHRANRHEREELACMHRRDAIREGGYVPRPGRHTHVGIGGGK